MHQKEKRKMTMNLNPISPYLRRVLWADALVCLTCGLLLVLGAQLLADLLALPATLLLPTGIFLLPYGALVAWIATRANPPRWAVWAVVIVNVLWVVGSFALLVSGGVTPNALGIAFIIAQAAIVACFAIVQTVGLRQRVRVIA
jgi:hypothetical protein